MCVCGVSVTLNLTCQMFVRLTNDTTYLVGNEGQKFRAVLSENAPLQSYSGSSIVVRIFDHVVESGHFVSRSMRRRSPVP